MFVGGTYSPQSAVLCRREDAESKDVLSCWPQAFSTDALPRPRFIEQSNFHTSLMSGIGVCMKGRPSQRVYEVSELFKLCHFSGLITCRIDMQYMEEMNLPFMCQQCSWKKKRSPSFMPVSNMCKTSKHTMRELLSSKCCIRNGNHRDSCSMLCPGQRQSRKRMTNRGTLLAS